MATPGKSTNPTDAALAIWECLNTIDTYGGDPIGPYKGHSNLSAVEIWQYNANNPETDFLVQEIETSDLPHWVDQLPRIKAGLQPAAGVKLLIGDGITLDENMPALDIRQKMRHSMRYVTKSFGIPSILCAADDYNARFWHLPQLAKAGFGSCESYYANLYDFVVGWTVNPQSQLTTGVLLFRNHTPQCRNRLLSNLERVRGLVHQDMTFPFVLAETAAYTRSNGLRRLGHHVSTVDNSIETFYELHGVRGAVDLRGFSAGTTFRAAQVAMSQRGLHASLELVRHFSNVHAGTSLDVHKKKPADAEQSALESGLGCVQQTIEALKLSAETYQARMSNQITLILSLFSQEDQSIGIDIAKASKSIAIESKRDSSSMKTLAVVTMVFLPGTFIATFFAMPLFDWHAPYGQIVDKRIWIYFLVTIPLTIFTSAVWWVWFTLKTKREQRENEDILGDTGSKGGIDMEPGEAAARGSRRNSAHLLGRIRARVSR
jgi:hypothetical protein